MKKAQAAVFSKFFPSPGSASSSRFEKKRAYSVEATDASEDPYVELSEEDFRALVNSTMATDNSFDEDRIESDQEYDTSEK